MVCSWGSARERGVKSQCPLGRRPKAAQPYSRTNLKQEKWLNAAGVRTATASRTPKTTVRDRTAADGQGAL